MYIYTHTHTHTHTYMYFCVSVYIENTRVNSGNFTPAPHSSFYYSKISDKFFYNIEEKKRWLSLPTIYSHMFSTLIYM